MTVANNYAPIRQIGNGSTTQFSAAWSMIAASYALVQLEDSTTGVRTTVSQGLAANQYQISITSSGFTVTMGTALTSSQYINISRVTGLDQTDSYRTSKGFQGEVEENSFDKLTAMVQDARYTAGLALTIPSGETLSTVLPSAANRAGQYLAFDALGNVIVSTAPAGGVAISTAMLPVVSAATLPLARTAMQVAGLSDNNTLSGTNNFTGIVEKNGTPLFNKINIQRFAASGTYTPTTGMVFCCVEAIGAGGSGGGADASNSGTACAGGGGGGEYRRAILTSAQIGASQTVTIGAGQSGPGAGNNTGLTGGTTSVGSLVTALGGSGGVGAAHVAGTGNNGGGGNGGNGGTGGFGIPGQPGGAGYALGTLGAGYGGYGGACGGGFGAQSQVVSQANNGNAGITFGCGGSGACSGTENIAHNGGASQSGIVTITEYISA